MNVCLSTTYIVHVFSTVSVPSTYNAYVYIHVYTRVYNRVLLYWCNSLPSIQKMTAWRYGLPRVIMMKAHVVAWKPARPQSHGSLFQFTCITFNTWLLYIAIHAHTCMHYMHMYTHDNMHGKYVYSTALEKEREIVKEETALRRKKQYAVMYMYMCRCTCVDVHWCTCISCTRIHTIVYIYRQPWRLRKTHAHVYIQAAVTA